MPEPSNTHKNRTIGILGGGQLGRMLAMAAGRMGYRIITLDPDATCPAAQFSNDHIIAAYDDEAAMQQMAEQCFVITYEFENIPVESARFLEQKSKIFPGSRALEISQDRLVEKNFLTSIGLKTAAFEPVDDFQQLEQVLSQLKSPAILKTRRMGYDGKGQVRVNSTNLDDVRDKINPVLKFPCIVEQAIDFECEISVIATRSVDGTIECFEPARNTHKDGILVCSQVPCELDAALIEQAQAQTSSLMTELNYVGTIGVEFFVTADNELLINEFAPRVHNSGHWTEAACLISQFEQHIRAVTGNPLGNPARHSDCVMHNLIGSEIDNLTNHMKSENTLVHNYGKLETRDGRKMGHVTTIIPRR